MLIGELRCCIIFFRYSVKVLPKVEKPLTCTLQREVLASILNPINTSQLHLLEIVDKSKLVGAKKHPIEAQIKSDAAIVDVEMVQTSEFNWRSTLGEYDSKSYMYFISAGPMFGSKFFGNSFDSVHTISGFSNKLNRIVMWSGLLLSLIRGSVSHLNSVPHDGARLFISDIPLQSPPGGLQKPSKVSGII